MRVRKIIVPSAPGGLPDIQARLVGNELAKQIGQQVIVDNRAGGSFIIGFELMAKATPLRSGDVLAGVAAGSAEEAVAARMCLADQPLSLFLAEPLIPYEIDEVTRLIVDSHDVAAFAPFAVPELSGCTRFELSR